jgi:hypothetical protein
MWDYLDPTVRPVAEMKWEVLTYLAHGTQCTVIDKLNYDGTQDSLVYERLGQVFGEVREKREYFNHKPIQEVGLYYSSRSRDWYGREDAPKYFAAFSGAHKALVQSHITLGMVMDENASIERLREFPVVYVPNAAILSEEEIGRFDEYVSGGGNLLVTGLSGLYDRYGRLKDESSLSLLIGANLRRPYMEFQDNYIRLPGDLAQGEARFLLEDIPPDWPALTWGPTAAFEATEAKAYGELLVAFRAPVDPPIVPLSAGQVIGPAIFIRNRGKGKAIYVPCAPDAAIMSDYRIPENRNLIRNLIRFLNPNPWAKVDAPLKVEIVVTRDDARRRLLVHFLSWSAPPTATAARLGGGKLVLPPVMEQPMAYKAQVSVRGQFSKADVFGGDSRVLVKAGQIQLETSSVHEVVIINL